MIQKQKTYTYQILTSKDDLFIHKASACLATSFIGVDVAGKWVQEPMVGLLDITYDDFYQFTKEYVEATVDQGYCIAAVDENGEVGGVLAGDTNAPEIIGEDVFEGSFKDMNVILHVLEDVDLQFKEDYRIRNGKDIEDGEMLHLFMIGVTAEEQRHDIIQSMTNTLMDRAVEEGLSAVYGEATNPKSFRVMEKYHGFQKYETLAGKPIMHEYKQNERLKGIPSSVSEGTIIVIKDLSSAHKERNDA
ncbi:hypothetical protein QRD89_17675 [Halobacillus sp. ACCC02827]|uniref:hypothetical protein n=1 Tax=Halobacillus sp. ACCC02827 TaxID=3052090 RepID=UPI0025708A50|nr:hypothetical protein [Halobacillus sp. ACCC02827]WJE15528.1 hypothetical protein QRD89_17675 [Halobacillus sp. ACCC02827]